MNYLQVGIYTYGENINYFEHATAESLMPSFPVEGSVALLYPRLEAIS
ncbi:hypothetical protein ACU8KH_05962 [Lachancea thermotolerans]